MSDPVGLPGRGRRLRGSAPIVYALVGALVGVVAAVPVVVGLSPAAPSSASPTPGSTPAAPTLGPTTDGGSPAAPDGSSSVETLGPTQGPTAVPTPARSHGPTIAPTKPPPTPAPIPVKARRDFAFFIDPTLGSLPYYTFYPLLNDSGPNPAALKIGSVQQITVAASYTQAGATGTTELGHMSIGADGRSLEWTPGYCLHPVGRWYCSSFPPFAVTYTISDGHASSSATLWIAFLIPAVPQIVTWEVNLFVEAPPLLAEIPKNTPLIITNIGPSNIIANGTLATFQYPCSSGTCLATADVSAAGGDNITGTLSINNNSQILIGDLQVVTYAGRTGTFVPVTIIQPAVTCNVFNECGNVIWNPALLQSEPAVLNDIASYH